MNISVLDKVLSPGVVSIDCPDGRFAHQLPQYRSDKSVVLDLASPLYYPGSLSKVYDRSPYGNHGTITGATWTQLSSGLWVLSYDGVDDRVNIPDHASLDMLEGTWIAWFKPEAVPQRGDLFIKTLNAGPWYLYGFYIDSVTSKLRCTCTLSGDAGRTEVTSDSAVTLGKWHCAIGVHDKSLLHFYLDDIEQGTAVVAVGNLEVSAQSLMIGAFFDGSEAYQGDVGEAILYNTPRSRLWCSEYYLSTKEMYT